MSTNEIIASADIGKFDSKLIGRDTSLTAEDIIRVDLRTNLYDLENGFMEAEGASYEVKFEDKTYIVGEGATKDYTGTSKTNMIHKVALYTGITKFLNPETVVKQEEVKNKVNLVLACPISVLKIQEAKEEFKKFMKGDGEIDITVDDKNYKFTIEDITIKAEGSGVVYLYPEIFKGQDVLLVDLGGLNMGISLYRNGSCKNEDRHIEECGTDELLKFVKEQASIYDKGNVFNDDDAMKALKDNGIKVAGTIDAKSVPFIEKAKTNYFNEVMKNIKKYKINIDRVDKVVFVGGTTLHIKDIIGREIKHSFIPERCQWTTAEGGYKVAVKKYSK